MNITKGATLILFEAKSFSVKVALSIVCERYARHLHHHDHLPIHTGWQPVQKGVDIDHDMKAFEFKVKTDSNKGSGDAVIIVFKLSDGEFAGRVELYFSSPPQFKLTKCSRTFLSFDSFPSKRDKSWKIRKWKDRFTVICNGDKVVQLKTDDTRCTNNAWQEFFIQDVTKIRFQQNDTASLSYYIPSRCFITIVKSDCTKFRNLMIIINGIVPY